MRRCPVTILSAVCFWITIDAGSARAQFAPNPPFSPSDPNQCQTFAADVQKYDTAASRQHEECLKAGKEDRPNLPPNSPTCSRYACQRLHDILFSDFPYTSLKDLRKRVDVCYAEVKEHLDRQAHEKQQEDERKTAEKQGEERRARDNQNRTETQTSQAQADSPLSSDVLARNEARKPSAATNQQTNAQVLPKSPPPGGPQPYTVGSMKVQDRPEQEQTRLAAGEIEKQQRSEQALQEMTDPFGQSGKNASSKKSAASSDGMVDPFGNSKGTSASKDTTTNALGIVDPFRNANSGKSETKSDRDIAEDKAKDIALQRIEELADREKDKLEKDVEKARSSLSPSDFRVYQAEVREAESYLKGLSNVIKYSPFVKDAWEASSNFKEGWNDFMHDCEGKGFEYVLKRLSPPLSKIYEGPVGWAASITFDPSSTQTPAQDFDPMSVINEPSHYSFDQRAAALQKMYISQVRHPEVWNDSKRQWLYNLTLQVYNSPDNPNIHLMPP
jgi:hypothetical protein